MQKIPIFHNFKFYFANIGIISKLNFLNADILHKYVFYSFMKYLYCKILTINGHKLFT